MKLSMDNGWTGGQYSLFRFVFGTYLCIHFVQLVPWGTELFSNSGMIPEGSASPLLYLFPNVLAVFDAPVFVQGLLVLASGLSVLFALGIRDRAASIALWYIWACIFGRNPLIANPGLPYVGWMLLAHAFLAPAPYGSWACRSRADPGSQWRMSPPIFAVAWILMALGYSYSGFTKLVSPSWLDGTALMRVLDNPLARPGPLLDAVLGLPEPLLRLASFGALGFELFYAPLALSKRMRPILWAAMLFMHLSLIMLIDFADLSMGMVMLHLFTFNPDWIPPRRAAATERIFYDGNCGLCHRAIRFVLSEDRTGNAFNFAALQGEVFHKTVSDAERVTLADSLVVRTAEGVLLTRSTAVIHLAKRLGGFWRFAGKLGQMIPRALRDSAYDAVARVRHRLFRRPSESCPILPAHLRQRFDR